MESSVKEIQNDDSSWTVESKLLLHPGLLGRAVNSTLPVSAEEKRQKFTCTAEHDDLEKSQRVRDVTVDLLCAYYDVIV